MLAINPQNRSGLFVITCGPGWMLWIMSAPIMSAMTTFDGNPHA